MNFLYLLILMTAHADGITVNPTGGSVSPVSAGSPIETVSSLYSFALLISAALAIGVLVYGGLKYVWSSANPNAKTDAREWITGALWGLLILAGLYIILYTISPNLTIFQLPTLTPLQVSRTATGGISGYVAQSELLGAGVGVKNGVSLDGIQQATVDEVVQLKKGCNCDVTITSALEGAHAAGDMSHATGYKIDLRNNIGLTDYITSAFTPAGNLRSDRAKLWKNMTTGAVYAHEVDPPANPPPDWAPHWDVLVGAGGM